MTDQNIERRSRRVVAEIISVGDEIVSGYILDTNSSFLSRSLAEIGVRTLYHTTVCDDMKAMTEAFAVALRRADVVVCTGGLGPTQDDLTRQAAAKVLGVELVFDQPSFEHTTELFKRRGREMPESNRSQAYVPKNSRVIYNPNGTAPGFVVEQKRRALPDFPITTGKLKSGDDLDGEFVFLTFPGVPAELYEMWKGDEGRAAVERYLDHTLGNNRTVYRTKLIHTFGLGESVVEAKLPGLVDRDHFPTVGITAKESVITLRIFAEGQTEEVCDKQIDDISGEIFASVGDYVFGEDDETLAQALGNNLRPQCRKVGVLEWGTRGKLAGLLDADVLAFGRVFGGSDVDEFTRLFGDSSTTPETLRKGRDAQETFSSSFYIDGAPVSKELLRLYDAERRGQTVDYLVAIGPYPCALEDANTSSGFVDVAFVDFRDPKEPVMRRDTFSFGGQPAMIDALFCNRAMEILLKNQ